MSTISEKSLIIFLFDDIETAIKNGNSAEFWNLLEKLKYQIFVYHDGDLNKIDLGIKRQIKEHIKDLFKSENEIEENLFNPKNFYIIHFFNKSILKKKTHDKFENIKNNIESRISASNINFEDYIYLSCIKTTEFYNNNIGKINYFKRKIGHIKSFYNDKIKAITEQTFIQNDQLAREGIDNSIWIDFCHFLNCNSAVTAVCFFNNCVRVQSNMPIRRTTEEKNKYRECQNNIRSFLNYMILNKNNGQILDYVKTRIYDFIIEFNGENHSFQEEFINNLLDSQNQNDFQQKLDKKCNEEILKIDKNCSYITESICDSNLINSDGSSRMKEMKNAEARRIYTLLEQDREETLRMLNVNHEIIRLLIHKKTEEDIKKQLNEYTSGIKRVINDISSFLGNFFRIKDFILNNDTLNNSQVIIGTNEDEIHAESLLMETIMKEANIDNNNISNTFFIALNKYCCSNCYYFLDKVNEMCPDYNFFVQARSGKIYDHWPLPNIFQKNFFLKRYLSTIDFNGYRDSNEILEILTYVFNKKGNTL